MLAWSTQRTRQRQTVPVIVCECVYCARACVGLRAAAAVQRQCHVFGKAKAICIPVHLVLHPTSSLPGLQGVLS